MEIVNEMSWYSQDFLQDQDLNLKTWIKTFLKTKIKTQTPRFEPKLYF